MSQVRVAPDAVAAAAAELQRVGPSLHDAQRAAAPATTRLAPAALLLVGAFANALFWTAIETGVASVIGYP